MSVLGVWAVNVQCPAILCTDKKNMKIFCSFNSAWTEMTLVRVESQKTFCRETRAREANQFEYYIAFVSQISVNCKFEHIFQLNKNFCVQRSFVNFIFWLYRDSDSMRSIFFKSSSLWIYFELKISRLISGISGCKTFQLFSSIFPALSVLFENLLFICTMRDKLSQTSEENVLLKIW